jgi:hypothetical protein
LFAWTVAPVPTNLPAAIETSFAAPVPAPPIEVKPAAVAPAASPASEPGLPVVVPVASAVPVPLFVPQPVSLPPPAPPPALAPEPPASTRPANRQDALLADPTLPQFGDIAISPLVQLLRSDDLTRKFEAIQRTMLEQGEERHTAMASGVALTGGLSIGYVVWLVRGGVLMSSMLSALPAWQMVDPMPVLAASRPGSRRSDPESDEPELERLFRKRSADAPAAPASAGTAATQSTENTP